MFKEKSLVFTFGSLLALVILALVIWLPIFSTDSNTKQYLTVTFFDVGQGDAIYIETPDGAQVLVDGGPDSTVLQKLATKMSWFDRDLDLVVGTHQDLDHVAGLVDVLGHYHIANLLITEGKGASPAAKAFLAAAENEDSNLLYARAGQVFALGASTTLTVLSPSDNTEKWASNTGSIVLLLTYEQTKFILTGDAPQGIEDYLTKTYGEQLKANVLKLGHHGSNSSSAQDFLNAVWPEYAVVSAGKDNKYNHPRPEVLERVAKTDAEVVSTMEKGDITFLSDGRKVWLDE